MHRKLIGKISQKVTVYFQLDYRAPLAILVPIAKFFSFSFQTMVINFRSAPMQIFVLFTCVKKYTLCERTLE